MIVIRDVNAESEGISLSRANHIVGKTTLYDMELDRCVITLVIIIITTTIIINIINIIIVIISCV